MSRFGLIDLLRASAAGLVLLAHVAFWTGASGIDVSGPLLARGDSGVAVFFAISAFLLLRPWVRAGLGHPTTRPLSMYAAHRAARILPAYWVALVAVVFCTPLAVGGADTSPGGWPKVMAHVFVAQGYTGNTYQAFSQTWSLTTEVTFYVLVPVMGPLLAIAVARGQRCAISVLAAVAVLGWVAQTLAVAAAVPVLALSVLGHAAWFAAGAAVAVWRETSNEWSWPWTERPGQWLLAALVGYLVACLPVAGPRDLTSATAGQGATKEVLYTILATLALAAATTPLQQVGELRTMAQRRVSRWLGDISYAVFLWHLLVLQALYSTTGLQLFTGMFWSVLVAVVAITGLVATASAYWLERPVMARVRQRSVPSRAG